MEKATSSSINKRTDYFSDPSVDEFDSYVNFRYWIFDDRNNGAEIWAFKFGPILRSNRVKSFID